MNDPLNAGDICTRIVVVAYPSMAVNEAARIMREHHVGCLVVVEEKSLQERIVVGMLTDRDIALGVVAADRDPHGMRVGDLMSRNPATARPQDSLLDLLGAMKRRAVRRLPVTEADGTLMGVVAIDDILDVLSEQMRAVAVAVGAASRHEQAALP